MQTDPAVCGITSVHLALHHDGAGATAQHVLAQTWIESYSQNRHHSIQTLQMTVLKTGQTAPSLEPAIQDGADHRHSIKVIINLVLVPQYI